MIFIEGADNSGKTKLIEKLVDDIGKSVKDSYSQLLQVNSSFGDNPGMINQRAMLQLGTTGTIHDRSRVISELVYGQVLRNKVKVKPMTIQAFYNARPLVIYCRPPIKTILRNDGRDQMAGVLDNHKELVLKYDDIMKEMARYGVRVINFDYANPEDYPKVLSAVKRELQDLFEKHCSAINLGA